MSYVGVQICDWCGQRHQKKYFGKLVLFKFYKTKDYAGQTTERSWSLCKRCFDKLSSIQSVGDKITEEIELKIDSLHLESKKIELLE